MVSETAISAILTASITGAGLVLAIYALITPISRKIFDERVKLLREKKKEFEKQKGKVSSDSSPKEIKTLEKLASEIQGMKIFPRYLSYGILLTFGLYNLAIINSILYFIATKQVLTYENLAFVFLFLPQLGFSW